MTVVKGASQTVQAAMIAAMAADPGVAGAVSGIYDGPPSRAAYPYIAVSGGSSADWSTKTSRGRELRLSINLWDDARAANRIHDIMNQAEGAIEAMPRDLPGHRIATLIFLRGRVLRTAAGPWSGLIEYRVRTVEI